jgi:hypothetical protein
MPGGMPPYGNPAAMHYGQQHFYMGQHQPGIGYNYGYGGQFAGGVQGGFGYPGGMQSAAYGGPHGGYEDHTSLGTAATPNTGYGKAGGGSNYRGGASGGGGGGGRNNSNAAAVAYQNQYNPQQQHLGGYGAQPYGMGYQGDHYQPRGGYGGMQDPYMQQQQPGGVGYGAGSFQTDDQYKGGNKKGNRGGPFQQQQQQQQQHPGGPTHQQFSTGQFGLQGAHGGGAGTDTHQPNAGWSNQGGWSGAASGGWQGSK